ncbi:MAG: hypothetical protein M1826_006599 [Phylliscum demangeonii]|nr:MAG: hypothetical protein M1826_006599 [Phylliscum demangeonii]
MFLSPTTRPPYGHLTPFHYEMSSSNSTFWDYLQTDSKNEPYRFSTSAGYGSSSQVDFTLDLPQLRSYSFAGIANIVPLEAMPNRFSGVLLGQQTFLDRMEYSFKPRAVMEALGELDDADPVARKDGELWGVVNMIRYVDMSGHLITFPTSSTQ